MTFLYLMKNLRNGYVKIGRSKNPKFRESTLQSEEPEVELLGMCLGFRDEEKVFHQRYAAHRLRGEWFNLSNEQIDDVLMVFKLRTMNIEIFAYKRSEELDKEMRTTA